MDRAGAFSPLRHPPFRWYYLATAVNLVGTTMAPVALAFAVLEVSDSPQALGLVLAANSIPMVVLLLVGGVVSDRLPRVLVVRAGALVLALTQGAVAALVLSGTAELWMLVVIEALNGTTLALSYPATAALLPQLVPRDLLQQANVLSSVVRGALRVVGPSVAALLVVSVGPGWALAVDAVTWGVSALLLLRVRIPPRDRAREGSTLDELREGWQLFSRTTWLWVVVLAFGVLNAIHSGAWTTLGPAFSKDTIGEQAWGLLLSAESVGLLATTAVMLRVRLERPLLVGMSAVSLMGLPILLLGVTDQVPVLLVAAFLAGAGIEVFNLGWNLAMQENVEEHLLSRAYSYDMLGSFVAIPVGQLGFGALALGVGYRDVLVVSGAAYVVVALAALASRDVRGLRRARAQV